MDRLKYLLIFFLCFFISTSIGYADECDVAKLKELAKSIEVSSEFDYDSLDMGIYNSNNVTIYGLTDELYVTTKDKSTAFTFNDREEDGSIKQLIAYGNDKLEVYSTYCSVGVLRTIDLDLKRYNVYSEADECKDLKDKVSVCSEFYEKSLTYDEFLKEIEKYKKNDITDVSNMKDKVVSFIKDNIIVISILLVLIIGGIVFAIIRKIKKNRLD